MQNQSSKIEKRMDMEDIENQLEEAKVLSSMGFMDLHHFEEFKYNAYMGLIEFGGRFSTALGMALQCADRNNSLKILRYWHYDCQQAALLYKMFIAKEKAEGAKNNGS